MHNLKTRSTGTIHATTVEGAPMCPVRAGTSMDATSDAVTCRSCLKLQPLEVPPATEPVTVHPATVEPGFHIPAPPADIIRLTVDQLDGIACIRCARTDHPMVPAGSGERGQVFECATHTAPAGYSLDLLKDSLTMAQRNGRACVQCGSSDYPLKPAGMLLDLKVVECDSHQWQRSEANNPPAWLTTPCPAWCTGQHGGADHPDDRTHMSVIDAVDMLTMCFEDFGSPRKSKYRPISLMTELIQQHLEAEPRICLHATDDKAAYYLSLTEARELVDNLTKLITRGDASS